MVPWCACMHAVEAFMCREGPLIGICLGSGGDGVLGCHIASFQLLISGGVPLPSLSRFVVEVSLTCLSYHQIVVCHSDGRVNGCEGTADEAPGILNSPYSGDHGCSMESWTPIVRVTNALPLPGGRVAKDASAGSLVPPSYLCLL